jgi:uncharacterized protein
VNVEPEDAGAVHPVAPEPSAGEAEEPPGQSPWFPSIGDASARRRLRLVLLAVAAAGLLVFLIKGADRPADPHLASQTEGAPRSTTTSSVETTGSTGSGSGARTPLPGFGEISVAVTSPDATTDSCLLLADTTELRERGLMDVTDESLGGYDGMLFLFDSDTTVPFYMRNTPMPLSLAYLSSTGAIVSALDMAPCGDSSSCPLYLPPRAYRMAIEVPKGRLADVGLVDGATMELGAHTCG